MVVKANGDKELFQKATEIFMDNYRQGINSFGRFSVAFSGGKTPKDLFKCLVHEGIEWEKVDIFMVDERYLPADHPDSNYKLLWDNLLSKIDIPPENVRYVKHLESLEASRLEYEKEINEFADGRENYFDLIVLGLGNDGHTASLFSDNFKLSGVVVPSMEGENHKYNRISLSMSVINDCRRKLFLLKKDKKNILDRILRGEEYPASYVKGDVIYLIDAE